MRKSNQSLITATLSFAAAVVFLFARHVGEAEVWVAIGLVWLLAAACQRMRHNDAVQPYAGRRLLRRFSRLLLFWS